MTGRSRFAEHCFAAVSGAAAVAGLYLSSLYSYPLFHSLAELLCVAVAFAIFMLTWNSRRFFSNGYLLFMGIAYLFVGIIDLVHTLAYKGMNIFTGSDADLPTQLWIARGYLQGLSLVIAPFFLVRKLRYPAAFAVLAGLSLVLMGSIFTGYFPACFVEGSGLTNFKIASEYAISLLFLLSLWLLRSKRSMFEQGVYRLISGSIILSIASELAFTFYINVYGLSNLTGHFFKLFAYYLLYRAIVSTGLINPYRLLFKEITDREHDLKLERDFTAAVLETAGSLVVVLDREGRVVRFNKACRELTGYSPEEISGRHFADYLLNPSEREHVKAVFATLVAGHFPNKHQNYWVARDGTMRLIDWSNTALLDGSGTVEYIIATGIDVTDQRAAEDQIILLNEELQRRVAELDAANRELEAFSFSVSHDLRAPLVGISGFAKALEEDYGDRLDDQGRDYLRRIRAAGERMSALIISLLDLSRLGRTEMTPAPANLSSLASSILEELRRNDPERKVECVVQEDMNATCDYNLLRIAMENLLGNAWKFSDRREEARIEVGSVARDGKTIYYVRDNGAGFDMNYAGKLFAPFQRLHSTAEYPGSGIGLATVKRIISRHGGSIWAESEPDRGATFYFTLQP